MTNTNSNDDTLETAQNIDRNAKIEIDNTEYRVKRRMEDTDDNTEIWVMEGAAWYSRCNPNVSYRLKIDHNLKEVSYCRVSRSDPDRDWEIVPGLTVVETLEEFEERTEQDGDPLNLDDGSNTDEHETGFQSGTEVDAAQQSLTGFNGGDD